MEGDPIKSWFLGANSLSPTNYFLVIYFSVVIDVCWHLLGFPFLSFPIIFLCDPPCFSSYQLSIVYIIISLSFLQEFYLLFWKSSFFLDFKSVGTRMNSLRIGLWRNERSKGEIEGLINTFPLRTKPFEEEWIGNYERSNGKMETYSSSKTASFFWELVCYYFSFSLPSICLPVEPL